MCPWCLGADCDVDPDTLCRWHYAEYLGMSLAELERSEGEQYAEWADWALA